VIAPRPTERQGDKADQAAEGEDAEPEPEARRLGREIARARGQREGEQDAGPAEGLAPGRDNGVDRERALARVPERENRRENGGKCGRAGAAAELQTVGQGVGDLRADDAEDHGARPVDPGHIAPGAHPQDERAGEKDRPDRPGGRRAELGMDRKAVGPGLADRGREDLDDPEHRRDRGDFVGHHP
jgi:hypothetical protein